MPVSCSSMQAILLSNEIKSEEGLPEMPLQSKLIKPCSKVFHVIPRGRAPRMSGGVEKNHAQALGKETIPSGQQKSALWCNIRVLICLRFVVGVTVLFHIPRHMVTFRGTVVCAHIIRICNSIHSVIQRPISRLCTADSGCTCYYL